MQMRSRATEGTSPVKRRKDAGWMTAGGHREHSAGAEQCAEEEEEEVEGSSVRIDNLEEEEATTTNTPNHNTWVHHFTF